MMIAFKYLGCMAGIKTVFLDQMSIDYINAIGIIIPIGIILATPIIKIFWKKIKINSNIKSFVKVIIILTIFMLSVLACINSTYNPFIYFNF